MIIPSLSLEKSFWEKGYEIVAGMDEAGRGPLAGPVVAGAVIVRSEKQVVSMVRDSKKMSPWQREKALDAIRLQSTAYGIGIVSAQEIDAIGIDAAVKKAMLMALSDTEQNFNLKIDFVLVDGTRTKPLECYPSERIKAGDLYHYSISAASVIAKVTRDQMMRDLARQYPLYGFESHVGYGTRKHYEALEKHGPCPLHRRSFLSNFRYKKAFHYA
jgi:ribonuclease HII